MTMMSFETKEQLFNTVFRTTWDGREYQVKCFKDGEYWLVEI